MGEGLLARARRVVEAGVGSVVETAERLTGTGLMRQAIRDVDAAAEQVRRQQAAAKSRHAHAVARQHRASEQAAQAREDARFVLTMGRDDLAQAAVVAKQAAEANAAAAAEEIAQAQADDHRLAAALDELTARGQALAAELRQHEAIERGAGQPLPPAIDRKVARAEESFARALGMAAAPVAPMAAVDALRRDKAVMDEMAQLRAGLDTPPAPRRGRKA